jgi:hypothetical protein
MPDRSNHIPHGRLGFDRDHLAAAFRGHLSAGQEGPNPNRVEDAELGHVHED